VKEICPNCNADLQKQAPRQVQDSIYIRKKILGLLVHCESKFLPTSSVLLAKENGSTLKSDNCEWQGAWSDLAAHLKLCEHVPVPCTHAGCNRVTKRLLAEAHGKECDFRNTPCGFCNVVFPHNQLLKHGKECERALVECPNGCAAERMERKQLPAHRKLCPNELVRCSISECSTKVERHNLEEHMQEALATHLQLMCTKVDKLKAVVVEQEGAIDTLSLKRKRGKEKAKQLVKKLYTTPFSSWTIFGPFVFEMQFKTRASFLVADINWEVSLESVLKGRTGIAVSVLESKNWSTGAIVSFSLSLYSESQKFAYPKEDIAHTTITKTSRLTRFFQSLAYKIEYKVTISGFKVHSLLWE